MKTEAEIFHLQIFNLHWKNTFSIGFQRETNTIENASFIFSSEWLKQNKTTVQQTRVIKSFAFASCSGVLIFHHPARNQRKSGPRCSITTPNVWITSTLFNLHLQRVLKCFILTKTFLLPLPVFLDMVYHPSELIILKGRMMQSDGDNPGPGNPGEIICLGQKMHQGRRSRTGMVWGGTGVLWWYRCPVVWPLELAGTSWNQLCPSACSPSLSSQRPLQPLLPTPGHRYLTHTLKTKGWSRLY